MAKSPGKFASQRFKWNSKAITEAVGAVKEKALRKSGAEIQKIAKRSVRRQKDWSKSSQPGKPPFSHSGGLRNSIRFAWDADSRSVVIGPIKLNGRSEGAAALERGGAATIETREYEQSYNNWLNRKRRTERGYDPRVESKWTNNKKKRGLSPIPENQMRHIRQYYGERQPGTVRVMKRKVKGKFKPRPFMEPALKKEIPQIPKRWEDAKREFKSK